MEPLLLPVGLDSCGKTLSGVFCSIRAYRTLIVSNASSRAGGRLRAEASYVCRISPSTPKR